MVLELVFLIMSFGQLNVAHTEITDSLVRYYLETGELKKVDELSNEINDNFLLGELAYFSHKFDKAIKFYSLVPLDSEDANDAIYRIIFIKENKNAELQDYVTAELFGRQKKWDKGIEILKKMKENKSTIAPSASILLANFIEQKGDLNGALKEYQNFINRFDTNVIANDREAILPQILLKMGKIYTTLGRIKEASESYRQILLKYPKSCVAPIARERLENL
ncbi:MAG: tetratricopeptide repeat protein [bacterium]|nr:tetratricopeptide repeat protein [bacterium]